MVEQFRFTDLFAGIGGFHLALAKLGGTCVLASEIDPDCQSVYRRNFPSTPLIGDIRDVSRNAHNDVPDHDVLAAGFPCQPFSKSGFQMGLRDRIRGTLFFEIMEIIRAKHPRFVVLENVRNLAGPRHRDTWNTIVLSLREEGYALADEPLVFSPHLIPPSLDGAPQVRERIFILAERIGAGTNMSTSAIPKSPVPGWSPRHWRIDDVLDADDAIENLGRYLLRADEIRWLDAWNDFIQRLPREQLPGFPIWVSALKRRPDAGGDIPDWKANFNQKNSALYLEHSRWISRWIREWRVRGFPPSRQKFEWQARGMEPDLWKLLIHLRPSGIRVKPPTYVPALVAITQTSIVGARRRRLTPREAARLQSFPDSFQLHPTDAVTYRQLGNAVNAGVARYVAGRLLDGSAAGTNWREQLLLVS